MAHSGRESLSVASLEQMFRGKGRYSSSCQQKAYKVDLLLRQAFDPVMNVSHSKSLCIDGIWGPRYAEVCSQYGVHEYCLVSVEEPGSIRQIPVI